MKQKKEIVTLYSKNFEAQLKSVRNKNINNCPSSVFLHRYFNNELFGKEKKMFEDHLNLCPICFSTLDNLKIAGKKKMEKRSLNKNWSDIEKELDEKFYSSLDSISISISEGKIAKIPQWKKYFEIIREKWFAFINLFLAPKIIAYAGSLTILLVISLYSITYFSRSDFYYLAEIKPEQQTVLRSGTSSVLANGLELFADGKYKIAIEKLTTYLVNNPNNYFANYYNGLCYLFVSKTGLPGMPNKYDKVKVRKGIKYLEQAMKLSRENQFYQEDCYWYQGKAYLMLGEKEKAKYQLKSILKLSQLNLNRKEAAKLILLKLQ